MKQLKVVLVVVVLLLFAVLVLQNAAAAEIRFLFFTFSISKAVLLGVAFVAGLACGVLLGHRLTRQARQS